MRYPIPLACVRTFALLPALICLACSGGPAPGQAPQPAPPAATAPREKPKEVPLADRLRSPRETDRPLAEKLRSPRDTIKTLLYAVTTYDLFPVMMEEAVACLDLDALESRPSPEDAALLALDLEYLLQALALPLSSIPGPGTGESAVLYDADGLKLALRRCPDGGWRFDADTLRRLPSMRRAVQGRSRQRPPDLAGLREGFTDPRTTLRQFMSDAAHGDFYAAARALDLSALSNDERREQGPALAQKLAFVVQHRGYLFRQEVPEQPDGPRYTWHADQDGRLALERVRQPDGKDAWLFTRQTVRNIPRMYAAALAGAPDPRYVRLGFVVPPVQGGAGPAAAGKRPDDVPPHLGSPRALLRGFFRTMDAADTNDARLADALEYLDLDSVPLADRGPLGGKLATKLEAVLRKLQPDLSAVPDDWNAAPQILGEAQGVRVEILRQRDGCWRFSEATVGRVPEMFDKLAGKARPDQGQGSQLDSARDTIITFQTAAGRGDLALAAHCLNLAEIHASAREELGPVLAFKLKYVLDRLGRIYVQEVPDNAEGPRYVLYRGELGRIVLDRKADEPGKGQWLFTPDTVGRIEPMFRAVFGLPPDDSQRDVADVRAGPRFWETPGVWLRQTLSPWLQVRAGALELYQWLGLVLAALASWAGARAVMAGVSRLVAWVLHRSGSALSTSFVTVSLRPLTWLAAVRLFFLLLGGLDLPVAGAGAVFAAEKFLLAGLAGWLGLRLIDFSLGIYTNSELLRPHRSLGDMIVPVSMRLSKTAVLLVVVTYMIYQVGEIELLARFLTGLGVAGLAASLAAQDAMKSFFGTLLLIGERAFKIGDRILVNGKEGVVEQVGFRSTRLRTAEDSLLTIPNAVIAAAPIDNMGARVHHRFSTTVLLRPDTALDRLLAFRDGLQAWLAEQPGVVRDKVDVHVHQVTERGVEVSLSLFLDPAAEGPGFREGLNCEILRLQGALGVDVAPPPLRALLEGAGERTGQAA
jgi:MscS family membrane protein